MTSDEFKIVRVASTVALGGFLIGFDATVISGAVPFIRDYFSLGGSAGSLKLGWAVSCLGWGAMEIFPNEERASAISIVGFWNSLVSASVTLLFPTELAAWGPAGTFLAYGLLAAAGLLFIVMSAPETKGKTLEELERILTRPKQALGL
jgi:MFS transporter, SP family, arabinose:H+ symporter